LTNGSNIILLYTKLSIVRRFWYDMGGRRQAVAAFSTSYMGFTWSGFQGSGNSFEVLKL